MSTQSLSIFALMLAITPSVVHAQSRPKTTNLMALVERIDARTVTLRGHQPLNLIDSTLILLQNGGRGKWSDLREGAKVKVRVVGRQVERMDLYGFVPMDGLGARKHATVKAVPPTSQSSQREHVEKSLFDLKPVTGGAEDNEGTSHGRTFRHSAKLHLNDAQGRGTGLLGYDTKVVYRLDESYDQLDLWLGPVDNDNEASDFEVIVRGDDENIYRHRFSPSDRAEHVTIDVSGRQGVAITGHSFNGDKNPVTIIGDPLLVRGGTRGAVVPLSPALNERVSRRTPLVWRGMDGASGYLLEIQCYASSSTEAGSTDRFVAKLLPGDATTYDFDAPNLPKGKWRWRVSALAPDGSFLGEAKEWSLFSTH